MADDLVSGDMPVSGDGDIEAQPAPPPEIPISLQCCKNCFNYGVTEVEGQGLCLFNPPVIDPRIMVGTLSPSIHGRLASVYPVVKDWWWCRSWERQEVGTPNAIRNKRPF
jgi:hypothetical protein